MQKHYIGITGITRLEEIDFILEILAKYPQIYAKRRIMLGFLMDEVLASDFHAKNTSLKKVSIPQLCALCDYIDRVISNKQDFMKIVHITLKPQNLEKIHSITEYAGTIDGFQLNIKNPDPFKIKELKQAYSAMDLIYQLKPFILTDIERFFAELSHDQLEALKYIDHFLIDISEGKGILGNTALITQTYQYMQKMGFTTNTFGFAGGLSESTLNLFKDLLPFYSIDAESQLRMNDKINKQKLQAYLEKAIHLML
jgi:hypothetical protein